MKRLSPLDLIALWPDEVGQWQDMGAVAVIGPAPDGDQRDGTWVDGLRAHIVGRLDRAPRLRQVLHVPAPGLGRPLWVDAQRFDVRDHVRVRQLPAPGTEGQLLDAIESLRRHRLDPRLPLWQVWLLTGLDGGARCALYLRVHHALADGLSAVMMLAALLFETEPTPSRTEPPPAWRPRPAPASRELFVDNASRWRSAVSRALASARDPRALVTRTRRAVTRFRAMSAAREPRSSLLRRVGAGRRLAIVRTDLTTLVSAAHSHGGTVNDALLAAISGGLRELLAARGELVDGWEPRAIVPVALARGDGDVAGNRLGQIIVPLPVGVEETSTRLALIASRTRRLKATASTRRPVVLRGARLQRAAMWFASRQRVSSIYVANLPGPRTPLFLLDAPVEELCPVVPLLGNLTIGVGALSYAGKVTVVTVADRDSCPDVDVFTVGMTDALATLG